MNYIKIVLFVTICIIVAFSCKRNNTIPTDPCKNAVSFKADFQISEIHGDSLVETDSVLINNTVSFKPTSPKASALNYATFEFQIGGVNYSNITNDLRLYFDDRNVSLGELITVRLIAKGKPNLACIPNDKSIDTIYKSFRIIHWKDAPIIGKYKGYFGNDKNKTDPQIVEVKYNKPDSIYTYGAFDLINIDKGCNTTITNPLLSDPYNIFSSLTGARYMVFIGGGDSTGGSFTFVNSCHAPSGFLQLKGRDTVISQFTYSKSASEATIRIHDTFEGTRIK